MGYSISWIGVSGKGPHRLLSEAGLCDTGKPDEANETPASGTLLSNGWYVMFFKQFEHELSGPSALARLSAECRVLSCKVEEHVMFSSAQLHRDGRSVWRVQHDAQASIYDLSTEGDCPPELAAIRERLRGAQDAAGGERAQTDYLFEVPLELAEQICGYKHDNVLGEDETPFTELAPFRVEPRWRFWRRN